MKLRRLLYFLFFLSGFSALVYEVVWARQLALVFGYTVWAVSTILTIFFAGLALGSYLFGRLADLTSRIQTYPAGRQANKKQIKTNKRILNPLFLYALFELGIGVYAIATPWIFGLIQNFQISLGEVPSGFSIYTFIFCFLGLIIPTTLMGGTLPAAVKAAALISADERGTDGGIGGLAGKFYSVNTTGAVLGAFLAGFCLISFLGVKESIWLAALINLAIGGIVLLYTKKARTGTVLINPNSPTGRASIRTKNSDNLNSDSIRILLAYGLAGFAALALEVLWTRVLILVFGSSTYSFTIILTVFLLGIALGSFLASKFLVERRNLLYWFAGIEIGLGMLVILITPILEKLPLAFLNLYQGSFVSNLWASSLVCFLTILPLTTLMGIAFPIAVKVMAADPTQPYRSPSGSVRTRLTERFGGASKRGVGELVGVVYSVNTVGGILGSFVAGFVLIAYLGLQRGILLSGFVYALAGLLVLLSTGIGRKARLLGFLAVVLLGISFFFFPEWNKRILSSGVYIYSSEYRAESPSALTDEENILFYKEGLSANITVEKDGPTRLLRINGKTDASTSLDLPTEILCGHLPLLFHPNPQKVLVIGLGSGITLGAVEQHPVEKIDMVEIEPAIIEASQFFDDYNHHALDDERLRTIVDDGRHFLLTTPQKYDVITSVPSNPWVKGNANLFTQEYFKLAEEHLEEEGIFLQWIQYYFLDPESLRTVLATFGSVFPEMTVWSPLVGNDLLLVGAKGPMKIDYANLGGKFEDKKVSQDLSRIGISRSPQILSLYLFGSQKVSQMTSLRLHTDNHPFLEFWAPLTLGQETVGENSGMLLKALDEPFPLMTDLTSLEKKEIEAHSGLREEVLEGKIALRGGNPQDALVFFQKALETDSEFKAVKEMVVQIYFDLARLAYLQNDFGEAKKFLLKVVELDASHFRAHLNLGAIYYQEGDFGRAAQEWAITKELEPESPEVERNLELLEKVM